MLVFMSSYTIINRYMEKFERSRSIKDNPLIIPNNSILREKFFLRLTSYDIINKVDEVPTCEV
jgi:hypothetical protein